MATPKEAVKQLTDHLPDQASWDDIMYELYVKQKIEAGLKAVEKAAPYHTKPLNSNCSAMRIEWIEPALIDLKAICGYIARILSFMPIVSSQYLRRHCKIDGLSRYRKTGSGS